MGIDHGPLGWQHKLMSMDSGVQSLGSSLTVLLVSV